MGKCTQLVIYTIFEKTKDFSMSQPVTYTLNVVIYRKWSQIVIVTNVDN